MLELIPEKVLDPMLLKALTLAKTLSPYRRFMGELVRVAKGISQNMLVLIVLSEPSQEATAEKVKSFCLMSISY